MIGFMVERVVVVLRARHRARVAHGGGRDRVRAVVGEAGREVQDRLPVILEGDGDAAEEHLLVVSQAIAQLRRLGVVHHVEVLAVEEVGVEAGSVDRAVVQAIVEASDRVVVVRQVRIVRHQHVDAIEVGHELAVDHEVLLTEHLTGLNARDVLQGLVVLGVGHYLRRVVTRRRTVLVLGHAVVAGCNGRCAIVIVADVALGLLGLLWRLTVHGVAERGEVEGGQQDGADREDLAATDEDLLEHGALLVVGVRVLVGVGHESS